MDDNPLLLIIKRALLSLEEKGEIVVCSATPDFPAEIILEAVEAFVPNVEISLNERSSLRSLVFHSIKDTEFFDWEMQLLTGLSADEFSAVAEKLPKG
ncbi:hypothetical protein KUV86_00025 [Halomonas sp. DP8Y7-3]|uniref:hypothetical protein n=1 Tax=Halomonas sp. DP8Y7-3 TaxID=2859079 RepID=UPI001C975E77|nr:hypothetical protein [Halomonas sp. DP8Y7-3]MBY5927496.1 hypothetical protein [Halomonas sp. DP8Y7-3]